jgi:hypothetical protein
MIESGTIKETDTAITVKNGLLQVSVVNHGKSRMQR